MKLILISLISLVSATVSAVNPILRTKREWLAVYHDGVCQQHPWVTSPQVEVDFLMSSAETVTFASDIDTISVSGLKPYESFDIDVVTASGDTALTRVVRLPQVIYENVPNRLKRSNGDIRLSREQALFDMDALMYALSQIHPDIYSVVGQERLLRAFEDAKRNMPDTLTTVDLYRIAAPIVSLIGDGHTCLRFPFNDMFTREMMRMPLYVKVNTDMSVNVTASLDSLVPSGAHLEAINGVPMNEMVTEMLAYVSGERRHFKLSRVNDYFTALFEMIYGGKSEYEIAFMTSGDKEVRKVLLPAVKWEEMDGRILSSESSENRMIAPYDYSIVSGKNIAVMEFNECDNVRGMKQFCDSMFADLRARGIKKLIIDVRNNGGGNSMVGDVLLGYIARKPFTQFSKSLVKVSPMTARMIGCSDGTATISFKSVDQEQYIRPLSVEEGHFDGSVLLLTSNNTFSSASSFAWAFKESDAGKTVGEETGGMNVCYGDILGWRAPISGLGCTISWKRFWQMNADETDIHGALPDYEVPAEKALDEALVLLSKL